ncbi:uncharacterized protein BJX67DRAFT_348322 [Aspergillus lucknowensis]|uniref:Uncharacterized protein n=1 Tax=Aspergillus lucknowensis TaxID=176173 RepID=A0ABR4LWL0_9EURO
MRLPNWSLRASQYIDVISELTFLHRAWRKLSKRTDGILRPERGLEEPAPRICRRQALLY